MGYPPRGAGGDPEGGYVHPDPSVLDMPIASAQHPNTPPAMMQQQQQLGPKLIAAPGMLPEPVCPASSTFSLLNPKRTLTLTFPNHPPPSRSQYGRIHSVLSSGLLRSYSYSGPGPHRFVPRCHTTAARSVASASPTTAAPALHYFTPMSESEREGLLLGHHGLDDPSSFSPVRRS
ncbi:hypothetical protein JCM21900_000880 [Sporobolomyces salmonicolor]